MYQMIDEALENIGFGVGRERRNWSERRHISEIVSAISIVT